MNTGENPLAVPGGSLHGGRRRHYAGLLMTGPLLALLLGGPLVAEETAAPVPLPPAAMAPAAPAAIAPASTAPATSSAPAPHAPRAGGSARAGHAPPRTSPHAGRGSGHGHSRDQVRQLVQRGEVHPLKDVLAVARNEIPGEILRIRLHRRGAAGQGASPSPPPSPSGTAAAGGERWVYEVRILDTAGRRHDLVIDGRTLEVVERT